MVIGNRPRAFRDEITGKTDTCIGVVKWSYAPLVGGLLLACVVATANFCSADVADDQIRNAHATGTIITVPLKPLP